MPLQGDQRALLQLLCERGQSYQDISGLLGISTEEVRARANSALTELGGADPDGEVALTDYLLGQADPIGRADAVRHLQGDPDSLALAERIQAGLGEIAPAAKQPKLPEARGKRRRAALPDESAPAPSRTPTDGGSDSGGSSRQTRLIAGLAALGVILVVAILAIAGVFSGDDDSTAPASSTTADGTTTSAATGEDNITEVALKPVSGSGVAGTAKFGLVSNQQLYVDVDVQGLDPSLESGKSYLVWLMVGDNAGYPIDRLDADENGAFSGRLAVPTPIAVAVGNQARSVLVSSTSVSALQSEIKTAAKEKVPILPFTGTELASGDIPLVKQNGRQKQGQDQQGG